MRRVQDQGRCTVRVCSSRSRRNLMHPIVQSDSRRCKGPQGSVAVHDPELTHVTTGAPHQFHSEKPSDSVRSVPSHSPIDLCLSHQIGPRPAPDSSQQAAGSGQSGKSAPDSTVFLITSLQTLLSASFFLRLARSLYLPAWRRAGSPGA